MSPCARTRRSPRPGNPRSHPHASKMMCSLLILSRNLIRADRSERPSIYRHVTTPVIAGPRTCGMTIARASAARNSEPVTQIRSSGAVSCRASSSASAGSAAMKAECPQSSKTAAAMSSGATERGFSTYRVAIDHVEQRQQHLELRFQVFVSSRAKDERSPCRREAGHAAYRPKRRPRRRCVRRRSRARAFRRPPRPEPANAARRTRGRRHRGSLPGWVRPRPGHRGPPARPRRCAPGAGPAAASSCVPSRSARSGP